MEKNYLSRRKINDSFSFNDGIAKKIKSTRGTLISFTNLVAPKFYHFAMQKLSRTENNLNSSFPRKMQLRMFESGQAAYKWSKRFRIYNCLFYKPLFYLIFVWLQVFNQFWLFCKIILFRISDIRWLDVYTTWLIVSERSGLRSRFCIHDNTAGSWLQYRRLYLSRYFAAARSMKAA